MLTPSFLHFTVILEEARPSERLEAYHITTRCHNPEDHDLNPSP